MKKYIIKSTASFDGDQVIAKLDDVRRYLEEFKHEAKGVYDDYGKPVVDVAEEYLYDPVTETASDLYKKHLGDHVDDLVKYTGDLTDNLTDKLGDSPEGLAKYLGILKEDVEGTAKKLTTSEYPLSNRGQEKGKKAIVSLLDLIDGFISDSESDDYSSSRNKRMSELYDYNNVIRPNQSDSDYNFKGRFCANYLDEFVSAIAMKESGSLVNKDGVKYRKYNIKNPDSYATGFTQIMPYSFKGFYESTTGKNFKDHLRSSLLRNSPASVWMADKYYILYNDMLSLNKEISRAKKQGLELSYLYRKKKNILKEMSIILDKSGISDGDNQEKLSSDVMRRYFDKFGDWAKVAIAWYAGPGSSGIKNFDENKLSDDYNEGRIGYLDSTNRYSGIYTYSRKVMKNFKAILGSRANSC